MTRIIELNKEELILKDSEIEVFLKGWLLHLVLQPKLMCPKNTLEEGFT